MIVQNVLRFEECSKSVIFIKTPIDIVTMALKIAPDKKKHFLVGIPLGALLQFSSFYFFPHQPLLSFVLSFAALTAICYGFELLSLITGKGHSDHVDAIAGVLGGILGIGLSWSIYTFS